MAKAPAPPPPANGTVAALTRTVERSARLAHWQRWQGRLLLTGAAAAVAIAIIVFSELIDRLTGAFHQLRALSPWLPFALTPLGGMLVVALTRRWAPGAEGSGIPQVIAALKLSRRSNAGAHLVTVRIAIAKVVLGALALFSGFAAGKEGPSVQIGASLMHAVRRHLPERLHIRGDQLLLAGGAAGIAVAFNTPIAGIVFAIEELGRTFDRRTNVILLTGIIVACAISISHWGDYTYFGRLAITHPSRDVLLPVVVVGLAGGILGGLFSRLMIFGSHPTHSRMGRFRSRHPVRFAGLCGLGVAVLGYASDGLAHGGGYLITKQALEGGVVLPGSYALCKMGATLLSYFSGIPGGIFAPSLSIGAGIGQLLHGLGLSHITVEMWMAMGMAAFLAGVTQVPVTTFVIVMEMIDGHSMVLSLIAVSLLASRIARIFSQSLYHSLSRQFIAQVRLRDREPGA